MDVRLWIALGVFVALPILAPTVLGFLIRTRFWSDNKGKYPWTIVVWWKLFTRKSVTFGDKHILQGDVTIRVSDLVITLRRVLIPGDETMYVGQGTEDGVLILDYTNHWPHRGGWSAFFIHKMVMKIVKEHETTTPVQAEQR